jgi:methylenetetrahydrofolate dehydrogenase (NADP+)/methenyltetrahydrofolate cyclohydrolase
MAANILDGKAIAAAVRAQVATRVDALRAQGVVPGLRVILAGDDAASAVYVRNKARAAAEVGIDAETIRLPSDVSVDALLGRVDALNADPAVHGILIQLPLPAGIEPQDVATVIQRVSPAKDVDGFHPLNLGNLALGTPKMVACTPLGCMHLLREAGVELAGKRAVVLGRSTTVGKPMALLLLQANATVTVCHSRTPDPAAVVRQADVVIAAVGRPKMVKADWIKPGAAVIDVGINRLPDGRLCGDVDFEGVSAVAGVLSPVPKGVGPMTIAFLMHNVCLAAERRGAGARQ